MTTSVHQPRRGSLQDRETTCPTPENPFQDHQGQSPMASSTHALPASKPVHRPGWYLVTTAAEDIASPFSTEIAQASKIRWLSRVIINSTRYGLRSAVMSLSLMVFLKKNLLRSSASLRSLLLACSRIFALKSDKVLSTDKNRWHFTLSHSSVTF